MADYGMTPPRAISGRMTRTTHREHREEDLGLFQGLALTVPIALGIWALLVWIAAELIG